MSSGVSSSKILEITKTYLNHSSAIDFCSSSVMNFSGKFFYSNKENYPSIEEMLIYEKMDKFKFINNLFVNIHTFTRKEILRFVDKLVYLENVYFIRDIKPHVKLHASFDQNYFSKRIYENNTGNDITNVDFNFLYERKLNNLKIDYSFFRNISGALFRGFDCKILPCPSPKNIFVRNLDIILCTPERDINYFKALITKLLHGMGNYIETLKIDASHFNNNEKNSSYPRIVFGANLTTFKLISNINSYEKNINILGETNKIEKLFIFSQKINNPENCVFKNLKYLTCSYFENNFDVYIKNFKLWFPNLIFLEISFELYSGINFNQTTIDLIYDCFPEITIAFINGIDMITSSEAMIFYGDVIFKTKSYIPSQFDIYKHTFMGKIVFDSFCEYFTCSRYDNTNIYANNEIPIRVIANKNQNFILNGCEIIAENNTSPTLSDFYITDVGNKKIQQLWLKDITETYPNLAHKNIAILFIRNMSNFHHKLLPYSIRTLDLKLKIQNKKTNLVITKENFPCLEYLNGNNINLLLSKSLSKLDLIKSKISMTKNLSFDNVSFSKSVIGNIFNITINEKATFVSNLFIKNTSLDISSEINEIIFEKNHGESVNLITNTGNFYKNIYRVIIKDNKLELSGNLKIYSSIKLSSNHYDINVKSENFEVIFDGSIYFDNGDLKLEGDNIHGNIDIHYIQHYNMREINIMINYNDMLINSNIVFIKSKNITGSISFDLGYPNNSPYIPLNLVNKILAKKSSPFEFNFCPDDYIEECKNEMILSNSLIWKTTGSVNNLKKNIKSLFVTRFENNLMILPGCISNKIFHPIKIITMSSKI